MASRCARALTWRRSARAVKKQGNHAVMRISGSPAKQKQPSERSARQPRLKCGQAVLSAISLWWYRSPITGVTIMMMMMIMIMIMIINNK